MCLSYPEIFLHQFLAALFCAFEEASLGLRRLVFVRRLGRGHTIRHILLLTEDFLVHLQQAQHKLHRHHTRSHLLTLKLC